MTWQVRIGWRKTNILRQLLTHCFLKWEGLKSQKKSQIQKNTHSSRRNQPKKRHSSFLVSIFLNNNIIKNKTAKSSPTDSPPVLAVPRNHFYCSISLSLSRTLRSPFFSDLLRIGVSGLRVRERRWVAPTRTRTRTRTRASSPPWPLASPCSVTPCTDPSTGTYFSLFFSVFVSSNAHFCVFTF